MKYLLPLLIVSLVSLVSATFVPVKLPSYASDAALESYSGYVTVDDKAGRALHYILIKAESDAAKKPLVVWYQGGPGCSGLIGLFQENGPFVISRDSTGKTQVTYTNLGWTKFANMLYLEQPAFVGFSYSNSSADHSTGDDKAASDNYIFIKNFLMQEFPEFMGRDLWFTGESYGGVYVPTLTDLVVNDPTSFVYKQFKGFMIGNPVFSCQDNAIGNGGKYLIEEVALLYWHGFASYSNYKNWTDTGCLDPNVAPQPQCQAIYNSIFSQVGEIVQEKKKRDLSSTEQSSNTYPSLDPDDIFQNFCTGNGTLELTNTPPPDANECEDDVGDLVAEYLNRKDVQIALDVMPTTWASCSPLDYNAKGNSMVPLYKDFFAKKPDIKILVYSGDLDILTVPFAFTQPCITQIGAKMVAPWQPWFVHGATAGYVEVYDTMTYATIKGGGHETPQYQPLSSYEMINRFMTTGSLMDRGNSRAYHKQRVLRQSDMLRYHNIKR